VLTLLGVRALAQTAPAVLPDYALQIQIEPATHQLDVTATIKLPAELAGKPLEFLLSDALKIESSTPAVERLPGAGGAGFVGINGSSEG
jgi:hypothetical protein